MTDQTVQNIRKEQERKTTERWRDEVNAIHNEFVFGIQDEKTKSYVCDTLYRLIKKMDGRK